jgi:selenocysteine lyase/cysteine desulfurase
MPFDKSTVRAEFDIPRDICYLNAAYMTVQPRRVLQAAIEGAEQRATPWRVTPADFFNKVEMLREAFAKQVNCSSENIAIVPSAGYGISVAANNLAIESGEIIMVLDDQFPSNFYSWQRLARRSGAEIHVVRKQDEQTWASAILNTVQQHGDRIRIAALARHHWSTAESIDLDTVSPALRQHGTQIALDLTQSVGAYPLDICELAPDFMVAAGYKWQFCPYGISFLYVADQHFDGIPIEETWMSRDGAEDFSQAANYTEHYQSGARRFDAGGRSSFSNIAGALAALEIIDEWGIGNISRELGKTNQHIAEILTEHGIETISEDMRAPHFQSARLPNVDTGQLASRLMADRVFVSQRGDRLRLAPHLYTDQQDLQHFEESLKKSML